MKRAILILFLFPALSFAWDANDFYSFTADWLKSDPNIADPNNDHNNDTIVNFLDFAYFAIYYDGSLYTEPNEPNLPPPNPNIAPTAAAVAADIITYEPALLTLSATDDNLPQPHSVKYIITSLPADGTLYDDISYGTGSEFINYAYVDGLRAHRGGYIKGGTLANLAKARRQIKSVPYTVSRNQSTLLYLCDTNSPAQRTFSYKANDGDKDSNPATVTLTRSAYDANTVSFNGNGFIYFSSPTALDFNEPFSITWWMRTKQAFCGLFSSANLSGTRGVDMKIEAGGLVAALRDPAGTRIIRNNSSYTKVNDGLWKFCCLSRNVNDVVYLYVNGYDAALYQDRNYDDAAHPSYIAFGAGSGDIMYRGDLNGLTVWDYALGSFTQLLILINWGPPEDYIAAWSFSEKTGEIVTDSVGGKTGFFSDVNDVLWHPVNTPLYEDRPQFIGGL